MPKNKLRKERAATEDTIKKLELELAEQERNNDFVLQRLKAEKDSWAPAPPDGAEVRGAGAEWGSYWEKASFPNSGQGAG